MAATFEAAWWARSGLAQTVVGTFGGRAANDMLLERWETADGDFLRVHSRLLARSAPTLLVLHGLEGSVRSVYVGEFVRRATAAGWNCAVLEFRSCGGECNRLLRSYHSGETGDLDFVVRHLLATDLVHELCIVGCSLGGNVLLKWLGERGSQVPVQVRAAAAISAPFDLERCAAQCDDLYGGVFTRHFLRTLIPKALDKARRFPGRIDEAAVRRCRTFRAFDDLVTAPMHGFRDARHYWATQSCGPFVSHIAVPTLLVNALDDPLVPAPTLPAAADLPNRVEAWTPARGGHVAFIAGGTPWAPRRWAEAAVLQWFDERIRASPAPGSPSVADSPSCAASTSG